MADRYKERRGLERLQLELTQLIQEKSGRTSPIHEPTGKEEVGQTTPLPTLGTLALLAEDIWWLTAAETWGSSMYRCFQHVSRACHSHSPF